MFFSEKMNLGNKELIIESGKMAKQANGSVVVKYGETVLLVTVCGAKKPTPGMGYFPLQVEYREKMYAAGKIPGGFIKRESRPSTQEILSARVIDRPIRPLFPKGFMNEVQVICNVLSSDGEIMADTLGIIGASAAINLSDIPFSEPVAGVRVGRKNGEFILNPTIEEVKECDIELVISGGKNFIAMVEGEAQEVSEEEMLEAVTFGQEEINKICDFQSEFISKYGKEKFSFEIPTLDSQLTKEIESLAKEDIEEITTSTSKEQRNKQREALYARIDETMLEKLGEEDFIGNKQLIHDVLHDQEKDVMRRRIIEKGIRIDGRKHNEVRKITCELDILPKTHGSALFTRGETQSLGVCTLGSKQDTQLVENIYTNEEEKFYLHYNFPPYSVGEIKRITGVSRREIGHGHLAQRAFHAVLPTSEKFPYTVRLVSEILESNGSSSMATVCSCSMAMMAAGVPIKSGVSGIAMGLIKEGDDIVILSDILGEEDHLGDMDFKVAGTSKGINSYQMDIKIQGITLEIMKNALMQAKEGRAHILGIMNETVNENRQNLAEHAPRILSIQIKPEEVAALIGPSGKNVKEIIATYDVKVDIEDSGLVRIISESANAEKAKEHIEKMFEKPEKNKIYDGKVVSIKPFGVFVDILPGTSGLVHISEIALERIEKIEEHVKLGDILKVKYLGVDKQGRHQLARKELLLAEKAE